MENPFTILDNSIDIIGAIFFANAVYWSARYILENHLSISARIILGFVAVLSSLHIYQVVTQVSLSYFADFRIWDVINWLTAFMFLMICHWVVRKDKK